MKALVLALSCITFGLLAVPKTIHFVNQTDRPVLITGSNLNVTIEPNESRNASCEISAEADLTISINYQSFPLLVASIEDGSTLWVYISYDAHGEIHLGKKSIGLY